MSKVCVINFSGNVGKSTIATHLLAPRIPEAMVIPVESVNADEGGSVDAIRADKYKAISAHLSISDAAIVDVGASNVETWLQKMAEFKGSAEDYDFFVVPTVSESKQARDTIKTIQALAELGVPASKIRVVFNRADPRESIEDQFATLMNYYKAHSAFTLTPGAVVFESELFGYLRVAKKSVTEIAEDKTDFKAAIKNTKDQDERLSLADALANHRLATGLVIDLDRAFAALLGQKDQVAVARSKKAG